MFVRVMNVFILVFLEPGTALVSTLMKTSVGFRIFSRKLKTLVSFWYKGFFFLFWLFSEWFMFALSLQSIFTPPKWRLSIVHRIESAVSWKLENRLIAFLFSRKSFEQTRVQRNILPFCASAAATSKRNNTKRGKCIGIHKYYFNGLRSVLKFVIYNTILVWYTLCYL